MRRRQRVALGVALACAVASTAGLLAATRIKSPEQARAEAAAPPMTLLTAVVQRRVLASTVVTRGTVVPGSKIDITPVVADVGAQVVTGVNVKAGDEVRAGQVLLAVSGRPLIVLPGALPAYRDLKPGDSGRDVGQLQEALNALGHFRGGDRRGYFGSATKQAVRKLYGAVGYDVPDTGGPGGAGDKRALTAARDAVDAARTQVAALRRRIDAGERAGPTEEPLAAQLARAKRQAREAVQAQADLVARTGPKVPLAEFVFVSRLPARVTATSAKIGGAVQEPLISLAVGELAVMIKSRPEQATLVRVGMPAELGSETLGQQAAGSVSAVGEVTTPPAGATDPPYRPIMIAPARPLAPAWSGLDVRVTITSARTTTEVLVVPLSAVSAGADGRTTVSVVDQAGRRTRVEVRAGVSGDGFVEVTPLAGDLAEGDRVVVGTPS